MELSTSNFWAAFWTFIHLFYPELEDPKLKTYNAPESELKNVYDFVIVGAGTAGCTLASRLTENPHWTVLLIEAGRDEDAVSLTPLLHAYLPDTDRDWNFTTVPQKRTCLSRNGECLLYQGIAVGGTSAINGMSYIRGNREDYDKWERLGNTGWGYDTLLKYFIKSENNKEPSLTNSRFHGVNGPLNVQYPLFSTPLRNVYIKAGSEIGLQKQDPNGKNQTGIDWVQHTIKGSRRESTASAFLNPARNRPNLVVIKKSFVTKIIFNQKQEARGVMYLRNNKKFVVSARKEVIVSAGVVNTAKLLKLSGIGPEGELRRHNINVISNLPVGRNLQDHLQIPLFFEINKNWTITSNIWKNNQSIAQYTKLEEEPLSTTAGEAAAFYNSMNSKEIPNIEVQFYSFKREFLRPQHKQIILLLVFLLTPKSVGRVTLRSTNPLDAPLIDTNYLADDYDYESIQKGIQIALRYMKTSTMSKYSAMLNLDDQKLCKGKSSSELITCLIRNYSTSGNHMVGTARMGHDVDDGAVVSPELEVRGVRNLRVVDASVMPFVPRGNTMAPTIAISEKAADIIKKYYANH